MEKQNLEPQQDKKAEYDTERKQKERGRGRNAATRSAARWIKIGLGVALLAVGGVFVFQYVEGLTTPEGETISRLGIHWHPELSIYIKGEKQEIPTNIGIGLVHNPIHTHDATGQIHLEFVGTVTKDDIRLNKFFDVWQKQFTETCIFEFCNGAEGTVKMFVNGVLSTEFGHYLMRDKDKIEIRFE